MKRAIIPFLMVLMLVGTSCNLPAAIPDTPSIPAGGSAATAEPTGSLAATVFKTDLPEQHTRFPPPPIIAAPKSTLQIGGESFDTYLVPGDRFRLVCKQPCELDERLIDALYVSYKVTAAQEVRTAGLDVLDSIKTIDIHLTRDQSCTRYQGELGLTGSYPNDPNSLFLCMYLDDSEVQASSLASFTPEAVIRLGGLGVFGHEYVHAMLWGRFSSTHDFVFPIEYVTLNPTQRDEYRDLCNPTYQGLAPLTYQLCQSKGLTFDQLMQSLLDVNSLYEDGLGNVKGTVGYNQYKAILNDILGSDVSQVFQDTGYSKIFADEGSTPYILPYVHDPCRYRATLVEDVTVPLGTILDVNSNFDKTWKIKNSGTCDWKGVQLVFVRGEAMTASKAVAVPDTVAGGTVDVTVPMAAPGEEGVHIGEWRLRNSAGKDFGPIINLTLYTRPGCSLPPKVSFFKAEPATIGPGALSLLSWGQVTNVDKLEIVGIGPVDPNGDRMLVQPSATISYTLQATCGTNIVTSKAVITVDPSLPAFAISNIRATADPVQFSGSCGGGKTIDFTGQFESSGPGAMLYQWNWYDGSAMQPAIFIVNQAGSHSLDLSPIFWNNTTGWLEFKVLAPALQAGAQANFTITCTP
jgi:hypothetical protein